MIYVLYRPTTSGNNLILQIPAGLTASQLAEQQGWDASEWAELDTDTFGAGSVRFPGAFTLVDNAPSPNTLTFDLSTAKTEGKQQVKLNYANQQSEALDGYTEIEIAAQAALPELSRIPEIQVSIVALNAISVEIQNDINAINAATTIDEVNNIVNPPTGILFTGRGAGLGPEDLNVSYYVEFNSASMTESETELYVPGTDTVIPYVIDPETGLGSFDSAGNCFNPGDYILQIREVATGSVIASFECPLAPANTNVAF
jgi:hypothetical protein